MGFYVKCRMDIKKEYMKHLDKVIGNAPSEKEMEKVNTRLDELEFNSEGFNGKYDKEIAKLWINVVSNDRSAEEMELFLKLSNCNTHSRILSLGAGIGAFESFLAKYVVVKGKVFCTDISKDMCKENIRIKNKLRLKNMDVFVSSAEKIKVDKDKFDIVLARRTGLSMKSVWNKVLKEVHRVLKENKESRFIYTVKEDLFGDFRKVNKVLNKKGLRLIEIDYFYEKDGTKVAMGVVGVK